MSNEEHPSTLAHINISEIFEGKRAREDYREINELAETIGEQGVIQPILVRPITKTEYDDKGLTSDHKYKLIAGGRRFRAANIAGLETIPAHIKDPRPGVSLNLADRELELLENTAREDFTWQERVRLVNNIHELYTAIHGERNWSGRKTAEVLERSHGSVARHLDLAKSMKVMPQLAEQKTEDAAVKMLKSLSEKLLQKQMSAAQQETLQQTEETIAAAKAEGKIVDPRDEIRVKLLKTADSNYMIGDAFDGMDKMLAGFEERSQKSPITFIECDPPYGIDLQSQKNRAEGGNLDLEAYNEIPTDDYVQWLDQLTTRLYKMAGDNCWLLFWFGSSWDREVRDSLKRAGWKVDDIPATWAKGADEESSGTGQTASPESHLGRATEFFYVCAKGKPLFSKMGRTNLFPHKPVPYGQKYHPTQRPHSLYLDLLSTFTFPRSVCFIPFLGSGAMLKAVYDYGALGFGFDLDTGKILKQNFLLSLEELVEKRAEELANEPEF